MRKCPPSWLSSRVEHTGSESKRGRQHQTIAPLECISAENWQFPMRPKSSKRIANDRSMPRMGSQLVKMRNRLVCAGQEHIDGALVPLAFSSPADLPRKPFERRLAIGFRGPGATRRRRRRMVGRGTGDSFDRSENLLWNLSVVMRMTRHGGHPEMRLRTHDNLLPKPFLIRAGESSIIEEDT